METKLRPEEQKFLTHYLETGDIKGSIIAGWPSYANKKWSQIYAKYQDVMKLWRVQNALDEAFKDLKDYRKFVVRNLTDVAADPKDKAPRVRALEVLAKVTGVYREEVDVHFYGKSDDEMREELEQKAAKRRAQRAAAEVDGTTEQDDGTASGDIQS